MRLLQRKTQRWIAAGIVAATITGGGILWWKINHREDYNKGNYKEAEAEATRRLESLKSSKDPAKRKLAVRARHILAFSAARQNNLALARERFAVLKAEAAKLPDKGKQEAMSGNFSPTLEEEGAYQHAVCTAALGDKKAAKAEYIKFIRDYPESPLVNGAVKRLERLNEGKLPKEAKKAWEDAQKIAAARQKSREREWSRCGPECLTELLRRRGEKADVSELAEEMKTNEKGTSLQSLSDTAKKHGFTVKGLEVTLKGLKEQPLPLIALIEPEHFVLVEKVTAKEVTVWDGNGKGLGKPGTKTYSMDEWSRTWLGIVLVIQPKQ